MKVNRIILITLLAAVLIAAVGLPTETQFQIQNGEEVVLTAGRNVNMVSGTTLPDGDPYLQRQNEPSLAVSTRNPLHLLAGANDYRTVDMEIPGEELPGIEEVMAADAWVGYYTSDDGGESWKTSLLPGFPQDQTPEGLNSPLKAYSTAADPWVCAGTEGRFYYSGLAFNRGGNSAIFVARFEDTNDKESGRTIEYLGNTIIVTGNAGQFVDMPRMAVDVPRGAGHDFIFLVYTTFLGNLDQNIKSKMYLTRSTNGGLTWDSPTKLSESQHVIQGAAIAIDPVNGDVYVAFRRFYHKSQESGIVVVKSTDRGNSFSSPQVLSTFIADSFDQPASALSDPSFQGEAFRTNSYPTIAVDDNHRVYVAWSQRGVDMSGSARIVMKSSISGSGWEGPVTIDPLGDSYLGHQIMPQMAFGAGKLTLVWYDQRLDWAADEYGYDAWISDWFYDSTIGILRHTINVWAAQADVNSYLTPNGLEWNFTQVSRYLYAFGVDDGGNLLEIVPVQVNCPNYPMFKGGFLPFMGDYIAVAPSPMFVLDENDQWIHNVEDSENPLFHVAWTDNRDVKPPLGNYDWTDYIPANSEQAEEFISEGRTGSDCTGTVGNRPAIRNQNVYTAKLTWGIAAGSPTNQKFLSLPSGEDRAFVVFVQNNTGIFRHFLMTILNQPPPLNNPELGRASFLQFDLQTELDVTIAPYSTVSRPVFVRSDDPYATVRVNIEETNEFGTVIEGGLNSTVILNADPTDEGVPGDEEETHDPVIYNPTNPNIVNPNIVNWVCNPNIVNPNIVNPNIVNPNIVNPNIVNPNIVNPNIVNPNIVNPNIVNPNIVNPNIVNPNIVNANPDDLAITDLEWIVKNTGNTATSYSLKTLAKKSPPEGVYTQLLVYREHTTPAVAGEDLDGTYDTCTLYEEIHHELLLNIANPNIVNPNIVNPNIVNPNIVNAAIENATFTVEPGDKVRVTLRVLDERIEPQTESGFMTLDRPSLQALNTEEFIDSLGFSVTSQAVNSEDAAEGVRIPPAAASKLIIGTSSLKDGYAHQYYETTLNAYGGIAPYTWSLTQGTLPSGLTLTASGLISGTPSSVGTYYFNVKVADSDNPQQEDTQKYAITIYAGSTPDPLAISTPPLLPSGVVNTWYGYNLEATGGTWPRTWNLLSGSLPPGLTFDSAGLISGTPTAVGIYVFSVRVTDDDGQYIDSSPFSLSINANTGVVVTISGYVYDKDGNTLDGVTMRGLPNTPITGEGVPSGFYSDTVPQGWSGTVEPFMPESTFSPASRTYNNLVITMTGENYNELATATLEWEARYDSGQANAYDNVRAMTADAAGNIYVTGYSTGTGTISDVATIKYDSDGNEIWVARYSSPGNYSDISNDIVVDPAGNVYITGYTTDALELHADCLTIKYDSDGDEQWVATWNSPDNAGDYAQALAVDNSGNVYITGYSNHPGANWDYVTIKYNSAGHEIWGERYNGTANDFDRGYDIAVDSSGDVYVTGESFDPATGRDFVTLKYDTNHTPGNPPLWVQLHDGQNGWDRPYALELDGAGNVYVTGRSRGPSGSMDFPLIKYNSDGDHLWTHWFDNAGGYDIPYAMTIHSTGKIYLAGESNEDYAIARFDVSGTVTWSGTYDGPASGKDVAWGVAVDSAEAMYITGYSMGSGDYYDIATVKYDIAGDFQWANRFTGPGNGDEVAIAIVTDTAGDITVAGRTHGGTSNDDYITIHYASTGGQNWLQRYNGPANDEETGWLNKFLAMDGSGNVYIAGSSMGLGTSLDFTAVKFDSDGNLVKEMRENGPGNYIDNVLNMTADSAGNVYLVGATWSGQDADYMTVKFDASGNLAWTSVYAGSAGYEDRAYGVAVDASGDVYVTGESIESGGTDVDCTTIKYSGANGQQLAIHSYDGGTAGQNGYDAGYAIAFDSFGNVYVTGESYDYGQDPSIGYDCVTIKYDSGLNHIWDVKYNGPANAYDSSYFIALDASDNVFICGESTGNGTGRDYLIVKYTSGGSYAGEARYDGGNASMDWPLGFVMDTSGNVYITGMSEGYGTFRDFATLKYNNGLNQQWAARYDGPLNSYDYGRELVVDSAGNVYVAGRSAETDRHADITTIKYDSTGNMIWIKKYNGPENDSYDGGAGIAIDSAGNVYIGGISSGLKIDENGFDWVVIKYKQ